MDHSANALAERADVEVQEESDRPATQAKER